MHPFALEDVGSLALFAKVVETRSFSAAARELGLAKSAVSKRIAVLEKKLGLRLLVRSTRQVTLSEAGQRVHAHCVQLLEGVRGVAAALDDTDAGERGRIRINAPGLFAQRVLAPLLGDYLEAQPQVEVELTSDDAMVDLTAGRYDLLVRISRDLPEQGVVARVLGQDRLVMVASPAYLERAGWPESPEAMAAHRGLHYAHRSSGVEWRFKGVRGPLAVAVSSRFTAGDDASLREAAAAGMGFAIMPRCFVAAELDAGALVSVLEDALWQPERAIHAVIPEGRLAPPRVRRLAAFLGERVPSTLRTTTPRAVRGASRKHPR